MPLDKRTLLGFLEEVDKEVERRITVVAAGGTALTLLDVKPSTIDVDFTVPGEDYDELQNALTRVPHGFTVDCWKDGMVFSQILPDDYVETSIAIRTTTKNLMLKALNPVDIIVTKIGRLDQRDLEDIDACIRKFNVTRDKVARRARQIEYVGHEENYRINLRDVLERFFKN